MTAIFDIDGTLVIKGVRPNEPIVALCNSRPDSVIITGRLEDTRAETTALLHKLGIRYRSLLMNTLGSSMDKQLLSKRQNATRLANQGPIDLAIDDNAIARSIYTDLGVKKVRGI
jgi:hypothetical protein